jgi:outer membrane protein assembly factor BamA
MTVKVALRAATFALLATAAGVLTPATATAQDITCEPGDLEVRDLEFRGNRAMDDDDLSLAVITTPSSLGRRTLRIVGVKRCLNRDVLGRDLLNLKKYYRDRGFYAAEVDTTVQPLGNDAVRVIFDIDEGQPLRLAAYTVTGLDGLPDSADIVRGLRLKVGQPFDILVYGADMDSIIRRLRDAGYYRAATVTGYAWDTAGVARAEAFITVVPGKRARFDTASIKVDPVSESRGQQIDTSIVRRLLGINRGDWYSDRAIVQAQRNLFQLGTYQHIEVAPLPDSSQPPGDTLVILGVRLTEDYMRQVDSEFGWATLDCGRVRMQYTDKNFLGTARRLEFTGQASKLGFGEPVATPFTRDLCTFYGSSPLASDSTFSSRMYYFTGLAVRQPRLLGTRLAPTLQVYSERRGEYKAYLRSTQVGADLSASLDIGDRMPLRVAYTFEYGRTQADPPALCVLFNRCDLESQRQIQQLEQLGVASAALARVRTDNLISPTRGHLVRAELRTSASKALLTSDSLFFNKGTGDVAWYRSLGWGNVLAIRLRGGAVLGRRLSLSDRTGFIPPQERLYAGGPTSVRGFQQNELGSKVYIARNRDVQLDTVVAAPNDTVFHFSLKRDSALINFDTDSNPDRVVPLGGNALIVANVEYRIRDPFFFPDRLQYTLFVDGGDVWTRGDRTRSLKWTPGIGVRALTPVGPVQVNVGWNGQKREAGPLYYNPDVSVLACVSPGLPLDYRRNAATGQLETTGVCPDFNPPRRTRLIQQLTFTFSIGPDF